mgnify:CR=1 FL=1
MHSAGRNFAFIPVSSGAANLKLIGGPASAGILVMNNNISKCNQISIITQSPTGIFEKRD